MIVIPATAWFAKIEIEGAENLPLEGPYVLAPNHYSEFDPVIVAVATWRMGRAPRFMAKESLFKVPVLGWLLRATGMIPVARASNSAAAKQTMAQSNALVAAQSGVIVYPEGSLTRDPDMWPMRGKTGAVRLALARKRPSGHPRGHVGSSGDPSPLRAAPPLAPASSDPRARRTPGRPVVVHRHDARNADRCDGRHHARHLHSARSPPRRRAPGGAVESREARTERNGST